MTKSYLFKSNGSIRVKNFKVKEISIMDKCQWCGKESNGYGGKMNYKLPY